MGRKKQVDAGNAKERSKRGAASAQKGLKTPVLSVREDLQLDSPEKSLSKQEGDAFIDEGRDVLCETQTNVPTGVCSAPETNSNTVVSESSEGQAKLLAVQQLCNAIDQEVKSRCAAIRTLTAAQYSSFQAQLDLQLSKFSPEEQNMPLEEFLKTCPGIKSVLGAHGRIELEKRSSAYPRLEESKRNLQDLLNDGSAKGANSTFITPSAGPTATQFYASEREQQEPGQKLAGDELSWPEYYMRLQTLGFNAGPTPSLGTHNNMNTPMIFKGGLPIGVTPKTLRLPKHGEAMLSVNGSPLGQFGKTPASIGTARMTRTSSRLATLSKRSMRDL